MAKLNLQLELNKDEDRDIFELINSYILSYDMLCMADNSGLLNPMKTEICDNNDGTMELRILDFEFSPDILVLSDEAAIEALEKMGINVEDIDFYNEGDDYNGFKS